jgi:tetratricopeptide (TPR) repeat protein
MATIKDGTPGDRSRRSRPKKQTGRIGHWAYFDDGSRLFISAVFPTEKARIERLVVESVAKSSESAAWQFWRLSAPPHQNPDEANFDYTLHTTDGDEDLDLMEVAPEAWLRQGGYSAVPRLHGAVELADLVFQGIKKKHGKYQPQRRETPVHLLLYATGEELVLSPPAIEVLARKLEREEMGFKSVSFVRLLDSEHGVFGAIHPTRHPSPGISAMSDAELAKMGVFVDEALGSAALDAANTWHRHAADLERHRAAVAGGKPSEIVSTAQAIEGVLGGFLALRLAELRPLCEARYNLAVTLFAEGKLADARDRCDRIIDLEYVGDRVIQELVARSRLIRGNSYLDEGRYDQARNDFGALEVQYGQVRSPAVEGLVLQAMALHADTYAAEGSTKENGEVSARLVARFETSDIPGIRNTLARARTNIGLQAASDAFAAEDCRAAIDAVDAVLGSFAEVSDPRPAEQVAVASALQGKAEAHRRLARAEQRAVVDCYTRLLEIGANAEQNVLSANALVGRGHAYGMLGEHSSAATDYDDLERKFADHRDLAIRRLVAAGMVNRIVAELATGQVGDARETLVRLTQHYGKSDDEVLRSTVLQGTQVVGDVR